VFENGVLRVYGSERDEVSGGELHAELCDNCPTQNKNRMTR
jgi:hypothetical protein